MAKITFLSMLALLCSGGVAPSYAAPVINEFLASNDTIAPDNRDFDDYSDWIELHNPAATNLPLDNYFLTDNLASPFKWMIPPGAEIPAGGYLMVRADGFDAGPGETHSRGYFPWGSVFQTRRYHANFKLSAGGEAVGLYRADSPAVDSTLVATNATWKYLDAGTDPGADWMSLAYVDAAWAEGAAELGYGEGDEATVVDYGPNPSAKHATTYFRHHFNVTDPSRLGYVRFRVLVDDGAVFYLNGVEFGRLRVPEGALSYDAYTDVSAKEGLFVFMELDGALFRAGENVLAAEVHQASPTSSDLSFSVELLASEITGTPILVDAITFGPQTTDVSYGRDATSTNGWSFFGEPTPGATNATEALTQISPAPAVTASLDSGFLNAAGPIALSAPGAGAIRYTLDGSIPSSSSALYTNALNIADTTILRARVFASGLMPGPVLTRSFFLGADTNASLPVVSFVADPETLFDDEIGIYENDTAYPFKGREVPVRVEMFEADQSLAFAVGAGARIAGENIWSKAQKPFNIYCRSKYGDDFINYQVFPDEAVGVFGELNLRNGGDDWEETLLRDAMMPSMLVDQMRASLYSYRPSVLFLNGEFWGIYNMRKRFDAFYFGNEHYLSEGGYDQLAYAHDENGVTVLQAEAGDTERYEAFKAFFTTNDLSDPAVYDVVRGQMDVDSFIDYLVAMDFAMNTSWSHNREFWKGRAEGSKWTWVVNDFDRGWNAVNVSESMMDDFRSKYALFRALDDNPDFVNRLIQRYAAHVGSTLHHQRISDKLDVLAAEQEGEIARHIDRWFDEDSKKSGIASLATRRAELDEIKQFAADRPAHAFSNLQTVLGLSLGMSDLTVNVAPADGGRVLIAGVPMTPEYANTLSVFSNTPVELSAESAPGHAFAGWSDGNTNATITISLTNALSLTANFISGAETVLPNVISSDTTLTAAGSPYAVKKDLLIEAGATLTIGPGVELLLPRRGGVETRGALRVNGTKANPVIIHGRSGAAWGNLSFVNATGTSTLSHVVIRDASLSLRDPVNLKAAVSGYDSDITLDHVDIVAPAPVFARYGSTTLRNCHIKISFTGDGINVKSGDGLVEDSEFVGNQSPDTDAIDFDDVVDGVIRGNRIYAFRGFNSDAIDVGEGCVDLQVVSNRVFNITDKGVSVGQASSVFIHRNLIVNCDMGVGVKDAGSIAVIDQNTFARNNLGVAAFEKNAGSGGGAAVVANCVFSRSKKAPTFVDALSSLSVNYSLSDTLPLSGAGNLNVDPLFTDPGDYDFSLTAASPAIDAGDPAHALDADGSVADMGAYYDFDVDDYPYLIPNVVVINEVLAHSHDTDPDWIELHNTSSKDLDLSGWYLSDEADTPLKFRIADGTILPANGYLVFYENAHFGLGSANPGALIPFALSENGDTAHLFGPSDGLRPDYEETETFGGSLRDVTRGRYFKESSRTYNFVSLAAATPGAANAEPRVGPVVISEIMYHPTNAVAEYIELVNISSSAVTLHDSDVAEPWRMTKGVDFIFPSVDPVVLAPGERTLLVRDAAAFALEHEPPNGVRVFQWDAGGLANEGETIELSLPGDVDELGVRQFIRVDRVDYSDSAPWPASADGGGDALARANERAYGNDFANWRAAPASAGRSGFEQWAAAFALPVGEAGPNDDPDEDQVINQVEYALGTHPLALSSGSPWSLLAGAGGAEIGFVVPADRPDVGYALQATSELVSGVWVDLPGTMSGGSIHAIDPELEASRYYRLRVYLYNRYD